MQSPHRPSDRRAAGASRCKGAIELQGLRFAYPITPRTALPSTASICRLRQGQTLAVVGPSGAGKSTLFDLLLRFFDPQEGRILS